MLIGHLPELIVVLIIALIFVGPGKLPEMGAALGKGISAFRKGVNEAHAVQEPEEAVTPALPPARKQDPTQRVG
jgi:sec-independent protein translocase protein TatA